MRVSVVGAGYVGLTTSACLAELGHDVVCTDIDRARIAQLGSGIAPFRENGLDELLKANLARGRLRFSTDLAEAVADREIVMIAVGTPKGADGEVDLSFVRAVAAEVAPLLAPRAVVTLKSTVAVGTAHLVREIIAEGRGALDIWVTSNPEFLREGSAVEDFMNPDRIVIGADHPEAGARLTALYQPLIDRDVPLVLTATVNAELIKYAANAFLALKIGFINDVADLCESIEADIAHVAKGIGLDRRIAPGFLQPGPGYGGSCFPKDTAAFAAIGRRHQAPQPLVEALIAGNEARKRRIARRVLRELPVGRERKVAVLGAAFKAGTDDMRESPALTIVPLLTRAGVSVSIFDPWIGAKAAALMPEATWHENVEAAAEDADLLLILTEWDMFRALDPARLAKTMRGRTIFDCRSLLAPEALLAHGFRYVSLGRPALPRRPRSAARKAPSGPEARGSAPSGGVSLNAEGTADLG